MYELTEKDKEDIKSKKSNPIRMLLARISSDQTYEHLNAQISYQLDLIKQLGHQEGYTQGHAAGVRNTEEWLKGRILSGQKFEIQERDGKPFVLGLDIGTGQDSTAKIVISKEELICIPFTNENVKDGELRVAYQIEENREVKYFLADSPEHAATVIETLKNANVPVHYIGLEQFEYVAIDSGKWKTWKSEEGLTIDEYGLNQAGELVGKLDAEEQKNNVDVIFKEFVEQIEPTTQVHLVDSHEELVFCANCHYQKIEHGIEGMAASCSGFVPGKTIPQNKIGKSEKIDDSGTCGPFPEYAEASEDTIASDVKEYIGIAHDYPENPRSNNLQPPKKIAPNHSAMSENFKKVFNTDGLANPTEEPIKFDEAGFMEVGSLGSLLQIEDYDPEFEMELDEAIEKGNHKVIADELTHDVKVLMCAIEDSHSVVTCNWSHDYKCEICSAYNSAKRKLKKLGYDGLDPEPIHFNYLLEVDHEVWSVLLCDIKEDELMTPEDFNRSLENPDFITKKFNEVTCPRCRRIFHNASEIISQVVENELFDKNGEAINMEGNING